MVMATTDMTTAAAAPVATVKWAALRAAAPAPTPVTAAAYFIVF
jgi:hypothetical protein